MAQYIMSESYTHHNDVIMSAMASQITGVSIVCSTVCPGADLRIHQSSASLAFVRGIHGWTGNSPHKKANNAENVSIWWRHHEHSLRLREVKSGSELPARIIAHLNWDIIPTRHPARVSWDNYDGTLVSVCKPYYEIPNKRLILIDNNLTLETNNTRVAYVLQKWARSGRRLNS